VDQLGAGHLSDDEADQLARYDTVLTGRALGINDSPVAETFRVHGTGRFRLCVDGEVVSARAGSLTTVDARAGAQIVRLEDVGTSGEPCWSGTIRPLPAGRIVELTVCESVRKPPAALGHPVLRQEDLDACGDSPEEDLMVPLRTSIRRLDGRLRRDDEGVTADRVVDACPYPDRGEDIADLMLCEARQLQDEGELETTIVAPPGAPASRVAGAAPLCGFPATLRPEILAAAGVGSGGRDR
jgi:hypothetical protein